MCSVKSFFLQLIWLKKEKITYSFIHSFIRNVCAPMLFHFLLKSNFRCLLQQNIFTRNLTVAVLQLPLTGAFQMRVASLNIPNNMANSHADWEFLGFNYIISGGWLVGRSCANGKSATLITVLSLIGTSFLLVPPFFENNNTDNFHTHL